MKVILEAQDVPLGSTVTKKTGEKEYRITDRIKIFGENISQKEIIADDGTRFLVADVGNVNVISGRTELVWHIDDDDLYHYLDLKINGPQS